MNFAHLLKASAHNNPSNTAIVFGERRLSYAQLGERANRLGNALLDAGVARDTKVAFLLHNSNEIVESAFAVAKAGAVAVPLNTRLVGRELAYIIEKSGASVLVYGEDFGDTVGAIRRSLTAVNQYIYVGDDAPRFSTPYEGLLLGGSPAELEAQVDDDDVATLLYTSGTTGHPKGVMRTHRNNSWAAVNMAVFMGCQPSDRELWCVPLWGVGFFNFLLPVLMTGGTMFLMKAFDARTVVLTIKQERVTRIFMVPTQWNWVLQLPDLNRFDLSSLRQGSTGSDKMPARLKEQVMRHFPQMGMYEIYGLSEGGLVCLPPKDAPRKQMCVGRSVVTNIARVVNEEGKDVGPDEVGEVILKGPSIMKGYYEDPESTAETLKAGWMHTGDLARVDDEGYIHVVDRKKDMIISGGFNVYPREIEEVLYAHPKVLDAAVIGVPDETWGESIKAVVVVKPGEQLTEEEVIDFARQNLASYKKPNSVDFVEALPRNPSGKVLKRELRDRYSRGEV